MCFMCMNIVISVDAVCTSCGTSSWPGHWYLSQGLAHVVSVVVPRFILYLILSLTWVEAITLVAATIHHQ